MVDKNDEYINRYKLYSYLDENGNFDYEKYKKIQMEGNKRKINTVFVVEENIEFLSNYLKNKIAPIKFGLCHGTRRGLEQIWFKKYLNCNVLGTEISDTAKQFPNTIQWDFHEIKDEWINAVDFIYSNSLDHSYDPERCLNQWMKCVRPGGVCILEYTIAHDITHADQLDPFGVGFIDFIYLITKWGNGNYCVKQIIEDAPIRNINQRFLVIYKF